MPRWRLSSSGPAKLGAAALPAPSGWAGGWQSRGQVSGSPGTVRVPAPAPMPGTDRSLAAMANAGNIGLPSSDFTYWLPGIYFQRGPREHAPVSVQSDNQMPVPALGPNGKPAIMSVRPVFLGQFQVRQPNVAAFYPTVRPRQG